MQGPSGIGKSTLARELCHEWNTTPTLRNNFDIVLLIKLRDKLVQNAKKLSQLFIHRDENLSERVVSEIENGDRILLIFDGFDKYPNSESSSSLIDNIMKGVYLPSATLLVTSHPIAKEWFKKLCYGFLHEQLKHDMISTAITYLSSYSFPQGPLTLMQYLFEAQSTALCHEILNDSQKVHVHFSNVVDCHAFSYCFANSSCRWHLTITSAEYLKALNHCVLHGNQGIIATIDFHWENEYLSTLQRYVTPKYIIELQLLKCSLTLSSYEALTEVVHNFPNLKVLNISNNKIGPGGAVIFLRALLVLKKLEHLNITNNNLGVEDGKELIYLIQTSSSLHKLSLGDSLFFNKDAQRFWSSIDFVSTVLPFALKASNLIELTLATDTCFSTSILIKHFGRLTRNNLKAFELLHVESLYHPCSVVFEIR